jgi:Histidine kinase-, DNA gyrase B-, and HSP90-like ATPase
MSPEPKTHVAHFDVHPSVVFKLGEDLITDDVQAIAELVKNAYDADSTWAVVRINTFDSPSGHPEDCGYVEVEDNGFGMDIETLERGWLTISNSSKRVMKSTGRKTPKGRTPLGDKGLGRLGAQRLGNRLTIDTTPVKQGVTHALSFDWRTFNHFDALSQVTVAIESAPTDRRPGTRVLVSDLREPDRLADPRRLQLELSKVISPYEGVSAFRLTATLNGETLDLAELDTKVRNAAVVRYELRFDGDNLHVLGQMRLIHLRPNNKRDRAEFERTCEADGGRGLFEHLKRLPLAKDTHLRRASRPGWWVEFERTISIEDVRPHLVDHETATPGPFHGEVDLFNLSAGSVEEIGVFDSLSDMRRHINDLAGVRIYRDGFNVRVDEDWLGLGQLWSRGKSWYGLRPATTMGYIALSAAENSQLVETTDREGFVRTPHYENFERLLGAFVEWTGVVQEFIGRGAVAYRQGIDAAGDGEEDTDTLVTRLSDTIRQAQEYRVPLQEIRSRLITDASEAEALLGRVSDAGGQLDDDAMELVTSLNALSRHASRAASVVEGLEAFVSDLSEQQRVGRRLQQDMEVLEEQLSLAYETVAVGLTAEALSHEIANIAERLARRTTDIARHVQLSGGPRKFGDVVVVLGG